VIPDVAAVSLERHVLWALAEPQGSTQPPGADIEDGDRVAGPRCHPDLFAIWTHRKYPSRHKIDEEYSPVLASDVNARPV
jgi:hypothetical protein